MADDREGGASVRDEFPLHAGVEYQSNSGDWEMSSTDGELRHPYADGPLAQPDLLGEERHPDDVTMREYIIITRRKTVTHQYYQLWLLTFLCGSRMCRNGGHGLTRRYGC